MIDQAVDSVRERSLIILEGCDGVGKSTIARYMAEALHLPVRFSSRTPATVEMYAAYMALIRDSGRRVWDRSFVSEHVYGPILRDRSILSLTQTIALSAEVAKHDGIFVLVSTRSDVLYCRLQVRKGTDMWEKSLIEKISLRYRRTFSKIRGVCPVVDVDTTYWDDK